MRSSEQIEYLYNYHRSWLVPCIESRGIAVDDAPTRAEFAANAGQWDPYTSVARDDPGAAHDAVAYCGIDPATQRFFEAITPIADETY